MNVIFSLINNVPHFYFVYCVSLRVLKILQVLSNFSSSKKVRNFFIIAKQETNRGCIVLWDSIVINPIAITCGGEFLSKDSKVIRALKSQ